MRWLLQERRTGHAGTLDPFATGVLLVCVGRATRLVPWLTGVEKTYQATIFFGVSSSTDDPEGDLTPWGALPSKSALEAVLPKFLGKIEQTPPAHSAIKVDGRRAYKLARKGHEVTMPVRTVEILDIKLCNITETKEGVQSADIEVTCGSGTYIRALARDIGAALGCGAYLTALRRTAVGQFTLEGAYPIKKDHALNSAEEAKSHLRPIARHETPLPELQLDAIESQRFLYGQRIAGRTEEPVEELAIISDTGAMLGVAAIREDVLHPLVVLG